MSTNTFAADHFGSRTLSLLGHVQNAFPTAASGMHRLMLYELQRKALEKWSKKEASVETKKVVEDRPVRRRKKFVRKSRRLAQPSRIKLPPPVIRQAPRPVEEPTLYDLMAGVVALPIYNATYYSLAVFQSVVVDGPRSIGRSLRKLAAAFLLMAA